MLFVVYFDNYNVRLAIVKKISKVSKKEFDFPAYYDKLTIIVDFLKWQEFGMIESENRTNVGMVIRQERQKLGISLGEAAIRTGVSKTMLGQVERGESSPTLSTIWKIASGLKISLSTLLTHSESSVYHVTSLDDLKYVEDNRGGIRVYTVFPFDPVTAIDHLYVIQSPNSYYASTTHQNAREERILVTQGQLTMHIGENTYILSVGDSITFAGNEKHAYENSGTEILVFQSMVFY